MPALTPMRMMFVITLGFGVILGVLALTQHLNLFHSSEPKENIYAGFNVAGVCFMCLAFVLMILLMLALEYHYKPVMLVIIIMTGLSLICYIVSVSVKTSLSAFDQTAWMLAAVWNCVTVFIIAIVFLFNDPDRI